MGGISFFHVMGLVFGGWWLVVVGVVR